MKSHIEPVPHSPEIDALLQRCGLPTSDLGGAADVQFVGCRCGGVLVGVVGLELYGAIGLLRSLAVSESERRNGLGQALVAEAERQAAARDVKRLYLLTTTAAQFFERRGYEPCTRAEAPAAIAATTQFSGLCSASSTFMCKALPANRS